ncbi:MAG: GMC family oxidoreductase [Candidatus Abyssobacteria bacterium SURF_5]|uniref:GMC family oxidoreductase n=1 Tax=Abyssobacteria bacterium (strain SURF_5) TaxID=2093360 RepID=A0A3A4MY58_ABYX5|nr:MAG: GMC family oxidoreductase [Candidatus Abyssubacteria bacterium SURF_5]
MDERRIETQIAVIGSGAAGGTIARELTRRGMNVVVVEKGPDWNWPIGHYIAYRTLYNIHRSKENVIIRRGVCTGGSTVIYSGNAFNPPAGFMEMLGIDFSDDLAVMRKELGVAPLPDSFYKGWSASLRLVESAQQHGITLKLQEKLIDSDKCVPGCDSCLLGCKRGAKWTSRPFLEEAKAGGALLLTRTEVERIEIENGKARGLWARDREGDLFIAAEKIILCAGGIGTPIILLKSGIKNAGTHFFTDPMSILFGVTRGKGMRSEMTYTFASEDYLGEFLMGTTSAQNSMTAQVLRHPVKALAKLPSFPHGIGMFVKLCDSAGGRIDETGAISKPLDADDRGRMEKGIRLAKKIMTSAGADPDSILVARYIGGHPGGTAGIGRVVNSSLQTDIGGLYVCDASVIPRSMGVPLVLILVSLARWFSRSLVSSETAASAS